MLRKFRSRNDDKLIQVVHNLTSKTELSKIKFWLLYNEVYKGNQMLKCQEIVELHQPKKSTNQLHVGMSWGFHNINLISIV